MLIKSLSLKDFKCFEQVDIDFGKITLLTGANSSGKSSLIYALLGIMQSKYFPQYFALNGELINMGGFDEVLKKKSLIKAFSIDIQLETDSKNNYYKTVWVEDEKSEQPRLHHFVTDECEIKQNENGEFELDSYFYDDFFVDMIISRNSKVKLVGTSIDDNFHSKTKYHLIGIIDDYPEFFASFFNIDSTSDFDFNLMSHFTGIRNAFNYIGSFRLPPERTYYRKRNNQKVGVNGEGYIDQIIEWEETFEEDSQYIEKYKELIQVINEIGLFKSIQSNKMKGGRFELNVQVNQGSELASLTDVGFGVSQFLPIIVADLQMENGSCLAISQPEIHLHPKLQATLGDYFCKQVSNTDKQYIVETHSEYLINRMRLLIVKGELKPEDVKLYYMENDGIKTTTYAIELTTDGQIKNAPQGFFDTYEMDVMDIALYASE